MKALVTEGTTATPATYMTLGAGRTQLVEVEEPKIESHEVLIKIACSGICFTDLHAYLGVLDKPKRNNPWSTARPPAWQPRGGIIAGHEGGGTIVEIGGGVPKEAALAVGDRVCIDIFGGAQGLLPAAGYNFATGVPGPPWVLPRERSHSGMYAEYVSAPWQAAVKVPSEVSDLAACSVEPWACGTRDARHSGQVAGDNVVVFGFDDYTASAFQWAKRLTPNMIVVVDPLEVRRQGATEMGADAVIDSSEGDPVKAIRDLMPFGPDIAYVGVDEWLPPSLYNIENAIQSIRYGGTIILTRIYTPRAFQHVDGMNFWSREVTMKTLGSFWCDEAWRGGRERGDWLMAVDAMARGWLQPEVYAPKVIGFDELKTPEDVERAFRAQTQERRKVVFAVGTDDPYRRAAANGNGR